VTTKKKGGNIFVCPKGKSGPAVGTRIFHVEKRRKKPPTEYRVARRREELVHPNTQRGEEATSSNTRERGKKNLQRAKKGFHGKNGGGHLACTQTEVIQRGRTDWPHNREGECSTCKTTGGKKKMFPRYKQEWQRKKRGRLVALLFSDQRGANSKRRRKAKTPTGRRALLRLVTQKAGGKRHRAAKSAFRKKKKP